MQIDLETLRRDAHRRHEAETKSYINPKRIEICVCIHYSDGTMQWVRG